MIEADDLILGALHVRGGSGTADIVKNAVQSESMDGRISSSIDRSFFQNTDLDDVDVGDRLDILASEGMLEYDGHRVYTQTAECRDYIGDVLDYANLEASQSDRAQITPRLFRVVSRVAGFSILVVIVGLLFSESGCVSGWRRFLIPCAGINVGVVGCLLGLVGLYCVDRATIVTGPIVRHFSLAQSDDHAAIGDAAAALANSFRPASVSILCLVLSVWVWVDLRVDMPNQAYGLLIDCLGGVLLGLEIFSTEVGNTGGDLQIDSGLNKSGDVSDGIFGVIFLVLGFAIQIISLVKWKGVIELVFDLVNLLL